LLFFLSNSTQIPSLTPVLKFPERREIAWRFDGDLGVSTELHGAPTAF